MQRFAHNSIAEDAAIFLAGHIVPPGTYHLVGTEREVKLDHEDILPATCDGHVGVYERPEPTWAELHQQTERE